MLLISSILLAVRRELWIVTNVIVMAGRRWMQPAD